MVKFWRAKSLAHFEELRSHAPKNHDGYTLVAMG
jgi:hypothetical protein